MVDFLVDDFLVWFFLNLVVSFGVFKVGLGIVGLVLLDKKLRFSWQIALFMSKHQESILHSGYDSSHAKR